MKGKAALGGLLAALVLSSCAPAKQPGDPAAAAAAADDFLSALATGQTERAWDAMAPATQTRVYDNDREKFADEVTAADWSGMRWRVGPVSDYDISWAVYVEVDPSTVPRVLTERRIVAEWPEQGVLLLVQIDQAGSYAIAGQGMDEASP